MNYLLDTNVLSELAKVSPNEQLLAWMAEHEDDSGLSVLTLAEMADGLESLPEGKRKNQLSRRLRFLQEDFKERILPVNEAVAWEWARYNRRLREAGFTPPAIDSFIAATALAWDLTVATRNTRDFPLVSTVNPFEIS